MSEPEPKDRKRAWALVRLLLGQAQIIGAVAGAFLLLTTGLNEITLTVVLITCACTTVSVLLFGGRRGGKP